MKRMALTMELLGKTSRSPSHTEDTLAFAKGNYRKREGPTQRPMSSDHCDDSGSQLDLEHVSLMPLSWRAGTHLAVTSLIRRDTGVSSHTSHHSLS